MGRSGVPRGVVDPRGSGHPGFLPGDFELTERSRDHDNRCGAVSDDGEGDRDTVISTGVSNRRTQHRLQPSPVMRLAPAASPGPRPRCVPGVSDHGGQTIRGSRTPRHGRRRGGGRVSASLTPDVVGPQSDTEHAQVGRRRQCLEVVVGRACRGGIPRAGGDLFALAPHATVDDVQELCMLVLVRRSSVANLRLDENDAVPPAFARILARASPP
jgi:hypothetical protein